MSPFRNYWSLLREEPRYLGFGFLLAFVSSFGQTFFIGQFKESILASLPALTHGTYGAWYSLATLSSATCLAYLGRRIDDVDLRKFTLFVCFGLAGACFLVSVATHTVVLVLGLFGLRLFGQGLMSHVAGTTAARYYDRHRGKALSLVNMGHPAGEAILPRLTVALLGFLAWQTVWQLCGVAVLALLVPAVLLLLRGHKERHSELMEKIAQSQAEGAQRQFTAGEALRDVGFYLLVPAVVAPAFITTGLFFHQDVLVTSMGWTSTAFATSFVAYSLAQVSVAPIAGALVDRFSSRKLLPAYLLPYGLALLSIGLVTSPWMALVLMAGAGFSSGIAFGVIGSLWAERYGVQHLGAIRSLASVIMVISTAISPPLLGLLIDAGVPFSQVALGLCGYTVLASVLAACSPQPPASRSAAD